VLYLAVIFRGRVISENFGPKRLGALENRLTWTKGVSVTTMQNKKSNRKAGSFAQFLNFSPLHDAHTQLWNTLLPLQPFRALTPADIANADPAFTAWETASDSITILAYDNAGNNRPNVRAPNFLLKCELTENRQICCWSMLCCDSASMELASRTLAVQTGQKCFGSDLLD
jgi:hypothetical protein